MFGVRQLLNHKTKSWVMGWITPQLD